MDLSQSLSSIGMLFFGIIPIYTQFSCDLLILKESVYLPVLGKVSKDFKICHF